MNIPFEERIPRSQQRRNANTNNNIPFSQGQGQGQGQAQNNQANLKKKESVEIFDQMTQLHERLHGRNHDSRLPMNGNSTTIGQNDHQQRNHHLHQDGMDNLISEQVEDFLQSMMGKVISFASGLPKQHSLQSITPSITSASINSNNNVNNNHLLPIDSNKFLTSKKTISFLHEFFSPLFCQLLSNTISSIGWLFHHALQEDEKGITLHYLINFFHLLLQMDVLLQVYLEYSTPQFLLNSSSNTTSSSSLSGSSTSWNNNKIGTNDLKNGIPHTKKYKQKSFQQLPKPLVSLYLINKEMIHLILKDYSDILSPKSKNCQLIYYFPKDMIERIVYHQTQMN